MASRNEDFNISDQTQSQSICIIGASGFIGKHLLNHLQANTNLTIKALTRTKIDARELTNQKQDQIKWVQGDLLDIQTLENLIEPNDIVLNLAYLSQQDNIQAITNLATACAAKKIARLIHVSTATVVGNTYENPITEETVCHPVSFYEKNKLDLEKIILQKAQGAFSVSILRPTAVFGPGGQNLLKLFNQLKNDSILKNFIKSSLLGNRSLNLVSLENVLAAITFLSTTSKDINQQVFLISDDASPVNNYQGVETIFMRILGKKYPLQPSCGSKQLLSGLLKILGKTNINPVAKYSSNKIFSYGLQPTISLENAVSKYGQWLASQK